MKLTVDDLKIYSRNRQVIDKLEEKFGSLEGFAEAIRMSAATINHNLRQSKEYTDNFKAKIPVSICGDTETDEY